MRMTWSVRTLELRRPFRISRGTMSSRGAVTVNFGDTGSTCMGRGEVVTSRYSDLSVDRIEQQLAEVRRCEAESDLGVVLASVHPAVAAAVWSAVAEHRALLEDRSLADHLGLSLLDAIPISRTVGIDTPRAMAEEAERLAAAGVSLVKVKSDSDRSESVQRLVAVAAAAPAAGLIVDPNESWSASTAAGVLADIQGLPVVALEQPLPAADHDGLSELRSRTDIPVIADEAIHTEDDLDRLHGRVDAVNIKLPKCGGVYRAHEIATAARERGLDVMLGCLVCSSLGIAPAVHLASLARWCDLDGHLLLASDPWTGLAGENGVLQPSGAAGLGVRLREEECAR